MARIAGESCCAESGGYEVPLVHVKLATIQTSRMSLTIRDRIEQASERGDMLIATVLVVMLVGMVVDWWCEGGGVRAAEMAHIRM